jgi:hypothetical protein
MATSSAFVAEDYRRVTKTAVPPIGADFWIETQPDIRIRISSRIAALRRFVLVLSFLPAGLVFVIAASRDNMPRPIPQPLDFPVIEERYSRLFPYMHITRSEVEQLLGPPTERNVFEAELRTFELALENGGRNFMPRVRVWDRWSDPNDGSRWVAVLYDGHSASGNFYWPLKKGF